MIARQSAVRRTTTVARAGFTLMEVLVVVAILVVLVSVSSVVVFRYLDESKEKAAKVQITQIEQAVMTYKLDHGDFPPDLTVLTQPEEGKPARLEASALIDPFGNPYQYEPGNRHPLTGKPLIYSQGSNPGDLNSQIRNWSNLGQ